VESPRPAFYAIIPAPVRYDKNISSSAKLLYGEITALCEKKGYCWASNAYFAELYGVSDRSVTAWLSELINGGHITTRGKDKRTIWIGRLSAENFYPIRRKLRKQSAENCGYIITSNITSNKDCALANDEKTEAQFDELLSKFRPPEGT
jgi:hypothetical protein